VIFLVLLILGLTIFRCRDETAFRHCEERKRRSNPAGLRFWIASLALAMTF